MDPYLILDVPRTATGDEIKAAYRKLASKHHPDRGGDTKKFQEIQAAYNLIGDPAARAEFDSPKTHHRAFHEGNTFDDFVARAFNQMRQRVYTVAVFVTLEQVANGSRENISINTHQGSKLIQLEIPKGIEDGENIRYENILPDGILQVMFRVHHHPEFERYGADLQKTVNINVFELMVGTKIMTSDIFGSKIEVVIPALTKLGTRFRIPRKGLVTRNGVGDMYVLITGKIPDKISELTLNQIKTELERTNIK